MHRHRNPSNSFLIVKMASGMDHGRVRLATTTTSHMAWRPSTANTKSRSLGWKHISLILDMHITFNWQLSYQEIRWPVSRDNIEGPGLELTKVTRAHVRLTCGKQGRIVRKPVNANPGFKVNQNITFSPIQIFCGCFVLCTVIIKTQNRRPNTIQPHRKVTKLKSKFYLFLG